MSHLPEGWTLVPAGELGTWRGGGTPSKANPDYWSGSIPWVSAKDMKVFKLHDTEDHITQQGVNESSTTVVSEGTVLLVTRSGILKRALPVAVTSVPMAINQDLKALAVRPGILPDYVAWAFRAFEQPILSGYTKSGTTVQSVEFGRFKEFPIPVPSLTEQERIVTAIEEQFSRLDAAEGLLARTKARTSALWKSVLNQLTSETWGGPGGGSSATVGELKQFSFYGPRFSSDSYGLEGPYVVRTSDISGWGRLDVSKAPRIPLDDATFAKYKVERGDLLVTRTGSIGTLAIYDDDAPAIPGAYLIQFRLDTNRVDPWFVFYCLESPSCQAELLRGAAGVGRPNLNAHAVDRIRIPLPPIQHQRQIVGRTRELLSVAEHLLDEASRVWVRSHSLRAAILRAAFSGTLMSGVRSHDSQQPMGQAT